MRFGVLTGGGDCPGLNAVIRAIVRKGINVHGHELVGFRGGWQGVLDNDRMPLDLQSTRGILPRGGTILRTSRTNVFKREGGVEQVEKTFADVGLDGLIAMCGDGERRPPWGGRTRGGPPAGSTPSTACRSSASRRRSTTTWARPTSPSGST